MQCPKCNFQNDNRCKFCIQCGYPLTAPVIIREPARAPMPTQPALKKKKPWYTRWWFWVLMGLGTIVSFFFTIGFIVYLADYDASASHSAYSSKSDYPKISTYTTAPVDAATVKENYINSCTTIDYATLSRNPDKYKGDRFKLTGQVIQVVESDSLFNDVTSLRINITKVESEYIDDWWKDTIIATVVIPKGADRILEDDVITFYGDCDGLYTYESILGQKISVPKIDIKYYEID